jgi:hypothetical protein
MFFGSKKRWLYLSIVLVSGVVLFLTANVLGFDPQEQTNAQLPRLFDTYGVITSTSEAEMARLDNFDGEFKKDPTSKVYIIGYNGRDDPPGKARRYILRAKNYLVEVRGVERNRIVTIEGGRREDFIVELWIVPSGASAPLQTPSIPESSDLGDNLMFDEYSLGYDSFGKYEDADARLGRFAAALKREPAAWGCIIAYAQNGDDRIGVEWDSGGSAKKVAQLQKRYLVKMHRFAPLKVTAVDGGYSEVRTVELWIMRPRARFDKGPFVYSHRLKARPDGTLTTDNRDTLDVCCRACIKGH